MHERALIMFQGEILINIEESDWKKNLNLCQQKITHYNNILIPLHSFNKADTKAQM